MRLKISHAVWLSLIVLLSFLVSTRILPDLQLRPGHKAALQTIAHVPRQAGDYFWVTSGKEEISQMVLYHDIGDSIQHARQADILMFGNSRQQTGLREEVIVTQARKLGLKAFTIATGHAEKTRFALELIRKHDLRPRVLVISGGPFIFTEGVSGWAEEVMAMNRWSALKKAWELNAAWEVQSRLHQYLPRIDYFGEALVRGGIKYRSVTTGWWNIEFEPDDAYPVSTAPERPHYRFTLKLARELKNELDRRGTLLVLTVVPYTNTRTGHLPFLSEKLAVPFVLPAFDGMVTSDKSHLDRSSASLYSKAFWDEFIQLQEVREKLSID
jgi:hypothetical protein